MKVKVPIDWFYIDENEEWVKIEIKTEMKNEIKRQLMNIAYSLQ